MRATSTQITQLRNRINVLKKELELLQTTDMNVPDKFTDFANNYFKNYGFLVFTMRDFRKKFHKYIKEVRTFTVNEIFEMLNTYCERKDLFLFPKSQKEMEGIRYRIRLKYSNPDEYCCIVADKNHSFIDFLAKKVQTEIVKIEEN